MSVNTYLVVKSLAQYTVNIKGNTTLSTPVAKTSTLF